jgi:hypothetical protein
MPTFWDATTRDDICRRVKQLTPDTPARWGKFDAAAMTAHLNDGMRMAMGELHCAPKKVPIRFFPLKQLILYVLPFPKGAPTAPELLARCNDADLAAEQEQFVVLAHRAAAKRSTDAWPDHPAFGSMSHQAWGRLIAKHTEHHLKQFSV